MSITKIHHVPSNVNVRLNKITSGIIFVLLCLESVNTEIPEEIVKLNIIVIIWGVISKRIKISPHTREIIDTRHVHLIPQTVHDTCPDGYLLRNMSFVNFFSGENVIFNDSVCFF